jgi:hypothetical protein
MRLLAERAEYFGIGEEEKHLAPRLCDLMPTPPSLQRRVCAIEPAEPFYSAALEMWQWIRLTSGLVKHTTSADVRSLGEFIGG